MSQQTELILERMSTVVLWSKKDCDICKHVDKKMPSDIKPAMVDGPTQPSYRWGYMCHEHFAAWGYPDQGRLNKRLAYDASNPDNHNLPAELLGVDPVKVKNAIDKAHAESNHVRPEDVREVESLIQF